MTPYVGQTVHYRPRFPEDHTAFGLPLAATVVYVWEGADRGLLNLATFDPDGGAHASHQVPFYDGTGPRPLGNYCELPEDNCQRIQMVS